MAAKTRSGITDGPGMESCSRPKLSDMGQAFCGACFPKTYAGKHRRSKRISSYHGQHGVRWYKVGPIGLAAVVRKGFHEHHRNTPFERPSGLWPTVA